jgi:hypothetical protein
VNKLLLLLFPKKVASRDNTVFVEKPFVENQISFGITMFKQINQQADNFFLNYINFSYKSFICFAKTTKLTFSLIKLCVYEVNRQSVVRPSSEKKNFHFNTTN